MRRLARVPWLRLVQLLGTLGLSTLLARSISWELLGSSFAGLRWHYLALAGLLLLMVHVTNVLRWRGLLPSESIPPATLSAYYGAGLFGNNFLPTGVGGDGVRVMLAARHVALSQALLSVGLDRGIGLLGLGFFLLPGLWFGLPVGIVERLALQELPWARLVPLALLGIALAALAAGLLLYSRRGQVRALLVRARDGAASTDRRGVRGWALMLLSAYVRSVWSNLGTLCAYWAVLQALGLAVSPGAAVWVALISAVAMLLPISINGLGVLESVFVVVLAGYGVPAPAALAAALLMRALGLGYSLLGGALSLRVGGWAVKKAASDSLS